MDLKEAAYATPDPERALNNLQYFARGHPEAVESLGGGELADTAMLFAYSQFLADYVVKKPVLYLETLRSRMACNAESLSVEALRADAGAAMAGENFGDSFTFFRDLKKRYLLLATLRFVTGKSDIAQGMAELSAIAEVLLQYALRHAASETAKKFGQPDDERVSIVALGKLGAGELNYSSDVDLLFVYGEAYGETSGIATPTGVRINRISCHEYYCKIVEYLGKLLGRNTADGFVYRVDLRLRPQGTRGELALPLSGYENYYESWGREWERLALLRARHVAGDPALGLEFSEMIRPFVYRKYIDMRSIEEIRALKKKIDSSFCVHDIKKGYGGIREIEFFAQTLQIIYGGQEPLLRERNLLLALHRLAQKNLIGYDDFSTLSDNYLYLRKLEQCLQMLSDTQAYATPSDPASVRVLARKMGKNEESFFSKELASRRKSTRLIYDSLFDGSNGSKAAGGANGVYAEASIFDVYTDETLKRSLEGRRIEGGRIKDSDKVVYYFNRIKETIGRFQTLRGRRLQEIIIPSLTARALATENPEMALGNLLRFTDSLTTNVAYLELFSQQPGLLRVIVEVFSKSVHLSSILMGGVKYLEVFTDGTPVRKTLQMMARELGSSIDGHGLTDGYGSTTGALAVFRKMEGLRLGIMYLNGRISLIQFMKGLSKVAQAVISQALKPLTEEGGPHVIAFGKLGGREITVNSDLDLVFMSDSEPSERIMKAAEKLLRLLTSHTREGFTYRVDTRLRAEGTRGPLVNSFDGSLKYYLKNAATWELQALLRARPITGERSAKERFLRLRRQVLFERGDEISPRDIMEMREKILRELVRGTKTVDVKLRPGGIEDIEFLVQYMQLRNGRAHPCLLAQNTLSALKRLRRSGLLDNQSTETLIAGYLFFREVETLLRLNDEKTLDEAGMDTIAGFMGITEVSELMEKVDAGLRACSEVISRYLV